MKKIANIHPNTGLVVQSGVNADSLHIIYGLVLIIFKRPYPEWLVLEIGLEHPGEIKQILKWVKIDLAVITLLPEVPVHVEFFKSKDEVIEEMMYKDAESALRRLKSGKAKLHKIEEI